MANTTDMDKERLKLAERLDKELDEFIEQKVEESKLKDDSPKEEIDVDVLAEELNNHPAFMKEIDFSKPLSPEVEGLLAMKYDVDDDLDKAELYKEDGNFQFKYKKYRIAIANYTEAIKCRCNDKVLNAVLYSNRAAANIRIENYRSALNDCICARKFKSDHMKAITKGSECLFQLKRFKDGILWCDHGLLIDAKNENLIKLRGVCEKHRIHDEKNTRQVLTRERKEKTFNQLLISTIKSKQVKLESYRITDLQSQGGSMVHLDGENTLIWPVLFLYPEHHESDFIENFSENSRFQDHIEAMFSETCDPPGWDKARKYTPSTIQIFFEDRVDGKLYKVDFTSSLSEMLTHEKFVVQQGTPSFVVLAKDGDFCKEFLQKYKT